MQAVILAAGMGTRIRDHHVMPKGFIPIAGKPLILHSIAALRAQGIDRILVITGYSANDYEQLAAKTGLFETCYNPYFSTYGSLYSLYCARAWVDEDCLLLESDILYEPRTIEAILQCKEVNVFLTSDFTGAGDEVYVSTENQHLLNMSKDREALQAGTVFGECVGITRLSYTAFKRWIQLLDGDAVLCQTGHYEEEGLVALGRIVSIFCLQLSGFLWTEIDTQAQHERAIQLYQAMQARITT